MIRKLKSIECRYIGLYGDTWSYRNGHDEQPTRWPEAITSSHMQPSGLLSALGESLRPGNRITCSAGSPTTVSTLVFARYRSAIED
jgi:hypothetical protein